MHYDAPAALTTTNPQPASSPYHTTFLHDPAIVQLSNPILQPTLFKSVRSPSISPSFPPAAILVHQKPRPVFRNTRINGRTVVSEPAPDLPSPPPPPAIAVAYRLRELRLARLNWSWNYGPENLWEAEFEFRLGVVQSKSEHRFDTFFKKIVEHARRGRYILKMIQSLGSGFCDGDCGNFLDLFLQGMELVMDITSEVKFFEVKINELATNLKVGFLRELIGEMEDEEEEFGDDINDN